MINTFLNKPLFDNQEVSAVYMTKIQRNSLASFNTAVLQFHECDVLVNVLLFNAFKRH